jgi:hypothetical protein
MENRYTCPCCGYLVFSEPPGSYDICPICDWEDDDVQLRFPTRGGGANKMSLVEAQKNFANLGAKGTEHIAHVRKSAKSDLRDKDWRMLDEKLDPVEMSKEEFMTIYRKDPTALYYWKKRP